MSSIYDKDLTTLDYEELKKNGDRQPMPIKKRSAQFAPFAALKGYEEAVAEAQRLTERRRELDDEEARIMNERLTEILENISECPHVTLTYFLPDKLKEGGSYEKYSGRVRRIDTYEKLLIFTDGKQIRINDLMELRID